MVTLLWTPQNENPNGASAKYTVERKLRTYEFFIRLLPDSELCFKSHYLPNTLGLDPAFQAYQMPLPSKKIDPFCNSHLQSAEEGKTILHLEDFKY